MRGLQARRGIARLPELAGDKLEIDTRVRWFDATQVPFTASVAIPEKRRASITASNNLRRARWSRSSPCRGIGSKGIARRVVEDRSGTVPAHRLRCCRRRHRCCFRKRDTRNRRWYCHRLARVAGLHPARRAVLDHVERLQGRRRRLLVPARRRRDSASAIPLLKEHWVIAFRGLVRTTEVKDGRSFPITCCQRSVARAFIAATRTSGSRTGTSCY